MDSGIFDSQVLVARVDEIDAVGIFRPPGVVGGGQQLFVDIAGESHGRCFTEVVRDYGGIGEGLLVGECGQRPRDGAGGGDGVGVDISSDCAIIVQIRVGGGRGTGGRELIAFVDVQPFFRMDTGVEGLQRFDVGDQGDLGLVAGESPLARPGQDQGFILVVGQVAV